MRKIYERREPDLVTMAERLGTTNWLNHERLSSRSSTLRGEPRRSNGAWRGRYSESS